MEIKDYTVAIDLGTTNVVTLVGRKNGDEIEVLASAIAESDGVIRGDIKNVELTSKALKQTIDAVQEELGIVVSDVFVGISGQNIKCAKHSGYIFIENSDSEVKEVDVIRLNNSMRNVSVPIGESIIHVIPQNYLVDGDAEMRQPVGVVGKKLEAMFSIITNDKAAIGRTERCLSKLSVKSTQFILNALASAEAVLDPDEKEAGVVVVDIGGGTTDVAIFQDNAIRHVAVIPMGGQSINKDIRASGILERYVEPLKVKYGSAISELAPNKIIAIPGIDSRAAKEIKLSELAWIIEARLTDIIDCVNVEIKRSGCMDELGAGIVLTGGCAQFQDIDKLFELHTGMNVRVAKRVVGVKNSEDDIINNPIYATAVGVLVKGISSGLHARKPYSPPKQPTFNDTKENVASEFDESASAKTSFKSRMWSNKKDPEVEVGLDQGSQLDSQDDSFEEEPKKGKKGGLFSKLRDIITETFEVVDEDIDDDKI